MAFPALMAIMELFSASITEDNLQAAPNYASYIGKIYILNYCLRETKDSFVTFSLSWPSIFLLVLWVLGLVT